MSPGRLPRGFLLFLAVTALGCASTSSDFSPQPPELLGEPKLWVPRFESRPLPNGMTLHVNSDPFLPLVSIAVGVRGGQAADHPDKAGLTSVLAGSLTYRTDRLDHIELAAVSDALGGRVAARVLADGILFSVDVLDDRFEGAVKLLAEIIQRPRFDPAVHDRVKAEQEAALGRLLDDPEPAALQGLRQVIFGTGHPLGLPATGTRRSLERLMVADVEARYRQVVRPENVTMVIAGRTTPADAAAVVERLFGAWKVAGKAAAPVPVPPPAVESRRVVHFVPRPGLAQTVICVGRLAPPEEDRRHHLVRLVAGRVAGSAGRWLRGIENQTYGVGPIIEVGGRTSIYGAQMAVEANATGSATRILVDRFDAKPDGFFDAEKVVILAQEGLPFYSIRGRAGTLASQFLRGLPLDHWSQLRERLDDMRSKEMEDVVFDFARSAELQVVLVGDPGLIRAQVKDLGELRELALAQ